MIARVAWIVALAACGSASPPAAPPPRISAPPPAAHWVAIPELGVRVACEGTLMMVGPQALVTCGHTVVSVMVDEDARTIDQALGAHEAEERAYLQANAKNVKRSAHRYRKAYENAGGQGTNYWVDVMIELNGRVLICQTGSIAPNSSPEAAAAGGDICETLSAAR